MEWKPRRLAQVSPGDRKATVKDRKCRYVGMSKDLGLGPEVGVKLP